MTRLPVVILPQAKADIGAAARRFDELRTDLGQAFIHRINATFDHIRDP